MSMTLTIDLLLTRLVLTYNSFVTFVPNCRQSQLFVVLHIWVKPMASHLGHANQIQRPWEAVAPIRYDYDKLWFVACVTFDGIPDADDRVNANHPIQLWNNMVYLPLACMDDDGIYVNSYDPNLSMVRKDNEAYISGVSCRVTFDYMM